MYKKLCSSLLLFLVGICLWIVFLFEGEMANYGIYTLVNYRTHEIMSIVPLVCILITTIWFITLIVKSIKGKTFKKNIIFLSILLIVFLLQIGYVSSQVNQISISTVAYVESINSTKGEIIINTSGEQILLKCPITIYELLEVNKEYLITYQSKKDNLTDGNVILVQLIK